MRKLTAILLTAAIAMSLAITAAADTTAPTVTREVVVEMCEVCDVRKSWQVMRLFTDSGEYERRAAKRDSAGALLGLCVADPIGKIELSAEERDEIGVLYREYLRVWVSPTTEVEFEFIATFSTGVVILHIAPELYAFQAVSGSSIHGYGFWTPTSASRHFFYEFETGRFLGFNDNPLEHLITEAQARYISWRTENPELCKCDFSDWLCGDFFLQFWSCQPCWGSDVLCEECIASAHPDMCGYEELKKSGRIPDILSPQLEDRIALDILAVYSDWSWTKGLTVADIRLGYYLGTYSGYVVFADVGHDTRFHSVRIGEYVFGSHSHPLTFTVWKDGEFYALTSWVVREYRDWEIEEFLLQNPNWQPPSEPPGTVVPGLYELGELTDEDIGQMHERWLQYRAARR
jgi:hypothetical protein